VRARLYDTRKTTPGLRVLEKYAVRCGGGMCHRIGLFDAVLIKDNHIVGVGLDRLAAVVAEASRRARDEREVSFVEVEVESLAQLERVLGLGPGIVDIVLLDNMGLDDLRRAVAMRDASASKPALEASGGVRLDTVRAIAETGVERISAGTLTHGATWLDVAMDMLP
jgi:nicotinate-nucleotide pyrophosphorylase (carboxylating)